MYATLEPKRWEQSQVLGIRSPVTGFPQIWKRGFWGRRARISHHPRNGRFESEKPRSSIQGATGKIGIFGFSHSKGLLLGWWEMDFLRTRKHLFQILWVLTPIRGGQILISSKFDSVEVSTSTCLRIAPEDTEGPIVNRRATTNHY